MECVRRQETSQPDAMYRKVQDWAHTPQLTLEETVVVYNYKHPDKPPITRNMVQYLEQQAFSKIAAAIYGEGW